MRIIAKRYLFRETLQAWAAVTVVLLLILVTSQFAKVLGDAAASRLPKEVVLQVMWLTSLNYLTILLPVGLFLSILVAMGRLYRDSEMYALMACGIGPAQWYRPLLLLAVMLAAAGGWLSLELAPWAMRESARIGREARERLDLGALVAGRFLRIGQEDTVVYAAAAGPGGRLQDVFVQRRQGASVEVVVAEEAWRRDTDDPDVKMFVFRHGRRYEGEPGSARFSVIEFAEHGLPFTMPGSAPASPKPETRPLAALLASNEAVDQAELQWRLSVPLMTLILAFMAVPLGRSSPRRGRYAGIGAAILVYVIYANLLGAARIWMERGKLPAFIGLWWVHALFLAVALLLLVLRFGTLRGPRRARAVEGAT